MADTAQVESGGGRGHRGRRRRFALVWVAAFFVCGSGLFGWSRYRAFQRETDCKTRLKTVYRLVLEEDGHVRIVRDLATLAEAPERVACSCCERTFIYRPIGGKVVMAASKSDQGERYRMLAWCPEPCHSDGRVVLLENGAVHTLSASAFQNAVDANYACENRSQPGS